MFNSILFGNYATDFEKMSNIVNYKGKSYFVDTNDTFDVGLETMIFPSEPQAETSDEEEIDFDKIDFMEGTDGLHRKLHDSEQEAIAYHRSVIDGISLYLDENVCKGEEI